MNILFMRFITMITLVLQAGDNNGDDNNYHRILDLASTPATAPSVMMLIALM